MNFPILTTTLVAFLAAGAVHSEPPGTQGGNPGATRTEPVTGALQGFVALFNGKDLDGSITSQPGGHFTDSRSMVVSGLSPGTLYDVQVCAHLGGSRTTAWSDAVQHRCL